MTNKNFNIYDPLSQGKALVLDGQTLAHIEVLQNSQGGTEGTLLQLLSRCVTPFGKQTSISAAAAAARRLTEHHSTQASASSRSGCARLCGRFRPSMTGQSLEPSPRTEA